MEEELFLADSIAIHFRSQDLNLKIFKAGFFLSSSYDTQNILLTLKIMYKAKLLGYFNFQVRFVYNLDNIIQSVLIHVGEQGITCCNRDTLRAERYYCCVPQQCLWE